MIIINNRLEDIIQAEYLKDKQVQQVLKQLTKRFKEENNKLILFKELVYVPEHQQRDIIKMYYDKSLKEHQEVNKINKVIS